MGTAAERAAEVLDEAKERWLRDAVVPPMLHDAQVAALLRHPALLVDLAIEAGAPTQHQLALQLGSLLAFTERHRLSYADHGHDCFELWCIERDYSRILIKDVLGRTTQENDQ